VEVDPAATQPRLVIPRHLLNAIPPLPGVRPGAEAPKRFGAASLPTIVAGLALTLSMASGGVWLVRKGKGRAAALLVGLGVFAFGTASLVADVSVPKKTPAPTPARTIALPADVKLPNKVLLEVADDGNAIKLIVPKGMVAPAREGDPK
jgi:hypothetical protein